MVINVPSELKEQVQNMINKLEESQKKREKDKETPYLEVIMTGEVKPGKENFEKIIFPAYCTYDMFGAFRKGMITHSDQGYFLWDTTRQWGMYNFQSCEQTLQDLWNKWHFNVCKAKLILKRG